MFQLIIIWTTGEKENYYYKTREAAEKAERGYHTAFGNQIDFSCINELTK